jgi:hypothetical protein
MAIGFFRLPISRWVSFGKLYISRNLCIHIYLQFIATKIIIISSYFLLPSEKSWTQTPVPHTNTYRWKILLFSNAWNILIDISLFSSNIELILSFFNFSWSLSSEIYQFSQNWLSLDWFSLLHIYFLSVQFLFFTLLFSFIYSEFILLWVFCSNLLR